MVDKVRDWFRAAYSSCAGFFCDLGRPENYRAIFKFAAIQLFMYFLFSVNARALAQGLMGWTFFSDLVYAAASYSVIRNVAENKNRFGKLGYILGGAFGSVLAIKVTKLLFGQ